MSSPGEYNVAKKELKQNMKSSIKVSNKKSSGLKKKKKKKLTGLIIIKCSLTMTTQTSVKLPQLKQPTPGNSTSLHLLNAEGMLRAKRFTT